MILRLSSVAIVFSLWAGTVAGQAAAATTQMSGGERRAEQFRIAGVAVNAASGEVLAQARVTIRDTKNPKDVQWVITGEDGRFEFRAARRKYALQGAKRGFIATNYEQHEQFSTAIVTGAGVDTEDLVLKLSPLAGLSGRVLDESGEPVRQARVVLWRENHSSGVSRVTRFRIGMTDDLGGYEFAPLEAGVYYLSVTTTPWYAVHPPTPRPGETPPEVDRTLDVVYPTAYYSGATESDDATLIPLRGGERLELDFQLAPVPALHVVYRGEQGEKGQGGVPFLRKRAFDGWDFQRTEEVGMTSPGVFEIVAAPGKYTMISSGVQGRSGEIEVSQDHQVLDTSGVETLSAIDVKVEMVDQSQPPGGLYLALRGEKRRTAGIEQPDAKGGLKFGGVASGDYEVAAGTEDSRYVVVRITSEGQSKSSASHMLKVPAGASMSVAVMLEKASESVEGAVRGAGKPAAGAMVVLIPKHPEMNSDRFRRDQSDLDGSFTLKDVAPGTYTVVAITDGWDLDWSRASVISRYLRNGRAVEVPEHSEHPVRLSEAIEVQQK
ncbi:MAG TPA: carboxypeptidase-like regulatory domain-containing protein [Terriglobales bacterium]|nr:carboxypeptidase-like regulatory domain-containing protein [Terriglobales bacterium]